MGNGFCKLAVCCTGSSCCRAIRRRRRTHGITSVISDPFDEGFGHSFCYVRSDTSRIPSSKVHSEESVTPTVTFRSISGASVCANTSTPLSVTDPNCYNPLDCAPATFESSLSFASVPLQPAPRLSGYSGMVVGSGPIERGFLSGPIERGFLSGPLDPVIFSGPLENGSDQFLRSFSHGGHRFGPGLKTGSLIRALRKAVSEKIRQNAVISAFKGEISGNGLDSTFGLDANFGIVTLSGNGLSLEDGNLLEKQNLHWAQGKAGEDRVHVVVSEEHGWVFVGIYDGFNGPDAPDYLVSNLYSEIHKELNGLLWEDRIESGADRTINSCSEDKKVQTRISNWSKLKKNVIENCSFGGNLNLKSTQMKTWKSMNRQKGIGQKCESGTEHSVLKSGSKAQLNRLDSYRTVDHQAVLKALSNALIKTEEAYLDIADKMVAENPELALMGSCVLVMLMKGDDVYVMNVGDSRAVLAQEAEPEVQSPLRKAHPDLARINEETLNDLEKVDGDQTVKESNLTAIQLTLDHSTCAKEEVQRIKNEHPDDVSAVLNDRVKGSLKVTRAFGAGFLKQSKWNDALLEMFRIEYVGTSPYITCVPSLRHHRLGLKDKFLILSSDGLYQYFTNEEAVAEVEMFIDSSPEGDPAQHLVEEVIFRAAKKAGMDFHELLEIPQGDRRRYHDDVSIIIISLEGRLWRSSV